MCVEAPHIPDVSGCAAPLPDDVVLFRSGPFEYRACPALDVDPGDEAVVALHRSGYMTSLPAHERVHVPAALAEALGFLARFGGEEATDDDGHAR